MASTERGKKKGSTVMYALLGLLVLGLGGFGAQSFSGNIRSIGKVGDREISVTTYANALRQEVQRVSQQFGTPISFQQAQAFGLDRSVRTQVVTAAALDNESDRLGLSVGDDRVRAAVLAIPAFKGLDGAFDREAYTFTLSQNGLTEREFETQIRDETARSLLQGAIVGGVSAPATYGNAIFAYVQEQRAFRLIRLDESALTTPVGEPDEAAIKGFYDAHPDPFTRPEAKAITYVKLTPEMLEKTVTVDEEALKAAYEARLSEFVQPERRLVERLVFGTEAEAVAAKARLDTGEVTFDALVAERGLALTDIDLGDKTREDLGGAGEGIFALTGPGVAGPLPSDLGPALFRMNGILAAQETTFDQARDQLRPELALDLARRAIGERTSDIEDRLAGGATLEDIDAETDMDLGSLDFFPGTEDPMAKYAAFATAAEALTAEDFPTLINLDDGGIVAMRLDAVEPPELRPLDQVRDQVIAQWKANALQTALKARAEAVQTALAAGETAESLKLTIREFRGLPRSGSVDDAPAYTITTAFTMAEGETRLLEEPGTITILTLQEINPADTLTPAEGTADAGIRAQIDAGVAQSLSGDLFDLFAGALEAQAGISLDEAAITAVHAQMN